MDDTIGMQSQSTADPIEGLIGIPWWAVLLIALFFWHGVVAPILSTYTDLGYMRRFEQDAESVADFEKNAGLYAAGGVMRQLGDLTHIARMILYLLVVWFLLDIGVL